MDIVYKVFIEPFALMGSAPDLLVQTLWEGLVSGVLYALIALGFVLIFKASGVFNYAQGVLALFAALTLVGIQNGQVPFAQRPVSLEELRGADEVMLLSSVRGVAPVVRLDGAERRVGPLTARLRDWYEAAVRS